MGKPIGGFQALSSKSKTVDLMLDNISKGLFVDASRNAAVSAGDRDLKSDVRDKKLREKYFIYYTLREQDQVFPYFAEFIEIERVF